MILCLKSNSYGLITIRKLAADMDINYCAINHTRKAWENTLWSTLITFAVDRHLPLENSVSKNRYLIVVHAFFHRIMQCVCFAGFYLTVVKCVLASRLFIIIKLE